MSTDLQIVGPAKRVEYVRDSEFLYWLLSHVEEYTILYGYIERTPAILAELKTWAQAGEEGATALLKELADDEVAEVMISS